MAETTTTEKRKPGRPKRVWDDAIDPNAPARVEGMRQIPSSTQANTTATKGEVGQIIRNVTKWKAKKPVNTVDEAANRLDEFFLECSRTGEIPTVEKMCIALGHPKITIDCWRQGRRKPEMQPIIDYAYSIMAAIDAELVSTGKLPTVPYIFRSKNFYGMSDETKLVVASQSPLDTNKTKEELQSQYLLNMPDDDGDK